MARFEIKKVLFAAAAMALVLSPTLAQASGGDFKGSVDTLTTQASTLPKLISIVLYIIGIALVGKGILTGKKFSENPGSVNGGLFAVLGPIAVGALLIASPSVASLATKSLGVGSTEVTFNDFANTQ